MLQPRTLADQAYDHLLRMILAGELEPGSRLQETDLAARLGVSRTPVREALGRLSEFGVVETRANHSAVVRHLGPQELIHFHQVREALEGMAAELAFGRLTDDDFARLGALEAAARDEARPDHLTAFNAFDLELHETVAARSGNPVLLREVVKLHKLTLMVHEQLEVVLIREGRFDRGEQLRLRRLGHDQHRRILEVLRDGPASACREAMVEHIRWNLDYKVGLMPGAAPPRVVGRRSIGSGQPA